MTVRQLIWKLLFIKKTMRVAVASDTEWNEVRISDGIDIQFGDDVALETDDESVLIIY